MRSWAWARARFWCRDCRGDRRAVSAPASVATPPAPHARRCRGASPAPTAPCCQLLHEVASEAASGAHCSLPTQDALCGSLPVPRGSYLPTSGAPAGDVTPRALVLGLLGELRRKSSHGLLERYHAGVRPQSLFSIRIPVLQGVRLSLLLPPSGSACLC